MEHNTEHLINTIFVGLKHIEKKKTLNYESSLATEAGVGHTYFMRRRFNQELQNNGT